MPVTDPIADMLTRMRNAQHVRHGSCAIPWSRMKEEIANVLKQEGYLSDVTVEGEIPQKHLVVTFAGQEMTIERISKPGRRIYKSAKELKPVLSGFGIGIVSTSKGVMSDKKARQAGVGGEYLCTIS